MKVSTSSRMSKSLNSCPSWEASINKSKNARRGFSTEIKFYQPDQTIWKNEQNELWKRFYLSNCRCRRWVWHFCFPFGPIRLLYGCDNPLFFLATPETAQSQREERRRLLELMHLTICDLSRFNKLINWVPCAVLVTGILKFTLSVKPWSVSRHFCWVFDMGCIWKRISGWIHGCACLVWTMRPSLRSQFNSVHKLLRRLNEMNLSIELRANGLDVGVVVFQLGINVSAHCRFCFLSFWKKEIVKD